MLLIREELGELAATQVGDKAAVHEEMGDVLFCAVNLARHHGVDAEVALRDANAKFERRFRYVESKVDVRSPTDSIKQAAMEAAWEEAKSTEKPQT